MHMLVRRPWIGLVVLLSALLAGGGYWYYRAETEAIYDHVEQALGAIGDLKAQQIQQWRNERIADVSFLAGSASLVNAADGKSQGHELLAYMAQRRPAYSGVFLVDRQGAVLAGSGDGSTGIGPVSASAVRAALQNGEAVLSDFFRDADGTVHLDAIAPVRKSTGETQVLAVLRSSAHDYLLPLIQSWPTPSRSAETLVVQRDGDSVLYVTGLRHQAGQPLTIRILLSDTSRPAVQAVLGRRGPTTGLDYRGVPVVADVRAIDGTPWFLVAKMDADEILAEAWERALVIGAVVCSLILLALSSTAYFYHQRQAGAFRDLYDSERRGRERDLAADRALHESVERFDLVSRATFNVIWDHDLATNTVWRNDNFQTLFGYRPEDIEPDYDRWVRQVIHPDDGERVAAGRRHALASGADTWSDSYRYRRKDGSFAVVEDRFRIVRDAGGAPVRLVGAMQDITHDAQAQGVLRLQSAALNAAANGIVITDRAGIIVWVNPAFTRLTGYGAEEAVGRDPRELVRSGVHDGAFYERLWTTILAGHVWTGEMTNRRKDGTLYQERQTITPVTGPDGQVMHFVSIKEDLTEEKRLEAQFLQSQKMEVVGRLAGGVAHDFNNLLTVINMTADLATENLRTGDPLREDFAEIRRAGERAAGLTRQLLAFSRKQILTPGVLEPAALVQGMSGMLQRLVGEDIEILFTHEDDVGRIKADAGQIEQVIMNLAVNARDAMPDGGTLTIEIGNVQVVEHGADAHPGLQPGPHVLIAVSDTGIGMDAETRARMFEPFFSTKEPGKGTGLGLSTVYGIVKQSEGGVYAYSEPGRGTMFKIYLPRVADALSAAPPAPPRTAAPASETVLLVEDERALRLLASRMLRSAGYTVLEAANAEEAVQAAERHQSALHLLLTDVVMPGINGRELAIRLAGPRPEMRVLFTSGYTDDAILRHGVLDDTSCFIGKPYSRADLLARVRAILDDGCRKSAGPPDARAPIAESPPEFTLRADGAAVAPSKT